jgi:hypothetical protein
VKRTRKRLALRLAASAVAGAVLTVAVAWGCAMRPGFAENRGPRESGRWLLGAFPGWPAAPERTFVESGVLYDSISQSAESRYRQLVATFGLPLRALQMDIVGNKLGVTRFRGIMVAEGQLTHGLPTLPLWPGFALDTAFYGGIVFLLWSAPGFVRRRSRLRRGACPACGYDLRGSSAGGGGVCPECGARYASLWRC